MKYILGQKNYRAGSALPQPPFDLPPPKGKPPTGHYWDRQRGWVNVPKEEDYPCICNTYRHNKGIAKATGYQFSGCWIECETCGKSFHLECIEEAGRIDATHFYCPTCIPDLSDEQTKQRLKDPLPADLVATAAAGSSRDNECLEMLIHMRRAAESTRHEEQRKRQRVTPPHVDTTRELTEFLTSLRPHRSNIPEDLLPDRIDFCRSQSYDDCFKHMNRCRPVYTSRSEGKTCRERLDNYPEQHQYCIEKKREDCVEENDICQWNPISNACGALMPKNDANSRLPHDVCAMEESLCKEDENCAWDGYTCIPKQIDFPYKVPFDAGVLQWGLQEEKKMNQIVGRLVARVPVVCRIRAPADVLKQASEQLLQHSPTWTEWLEESQTNGSHNYTTVRSEDSVTTVLIDDIMKVLSCTLNSSTTTNVAADVIKDTDRIEPPTWQAIPLLHYHLNGSAKKIFEVMDWKTATEYRMDVREDLDAGFEEARKDRATYAFEIGNIHHGLHNCVMMPARAFYRVKTVKSHVTLPKTFEDALEHQFFYTNNIDIDSLDKGLRLFRESKYEFDALPIVDIKQKWIKYFENFEYVKYYVSRKHNKYREAMLDMLHSYPQEENDNVQTYVGISPKFYMKNADFLTHALSEMAEAEKYASWTDRANEELRSSIFITYRNELGRVRSSL